MANEADYKRVFKKVADVPMDDSDKCDGGESNKSDVDKSAPLALGR